MKRKSIIVTALVLAVTMLISACGSTAGSTASGTEASAQESKTEEAAASDWKPTGTVTIYCQSAAGGAADYAHRAIAQALGEYWGNTVQVVNQTGGSGGVAAGTVWNSEHDGTSVFGCGEPIYCMRALGVFDKAPTDWDLMPILNTVAVLSVPEGSPYKTIEDLIAACKEKEVNMASGTAGSIWSLKASIFADAAGITYNRLNYEGSVPSQTAAMSGEVEFVVTGLAEQIEYIKSGKLVPLAMIESESYEVDGFGTIPAVTDVVPSFADAKQPIQCIMVAIPNDCPDEVRKGWEEAYHYAMSTDTVKKAIEDGNFNNMEMSEEEAAKLAIEMEKIFSWQLYDSEVAPNDPSRFGIERP